MMSTLGNRLRRCRKESGYKQQDVCARVGISQGTLSELENDKYPTSSFVPQLAKLYGVEALWLATGSGPKTKEEARTYHVSETAMKIAIAVNEFPADYQDALLHLLTIETLKKEGAKAIAAPAALTGELLPADRQDK